jgi:hypothetical protein
VEESVVFEVAVSGVSGEGVVWTVPVGLKGWRPFLKYSAAALGAEDVVSETEVFVQK